MRVVTLSNSSAGSLDNPPTLHAFAASADQNLSTQATAAHKSRLHCTKWLAASWVYVMKYCTSHTPDVNENVPLEDPLTSHSTNSYTLPSGCAIETMFVSASSTSSGGVTTLSMKG